MTGFLVVAIAGFVWFGVIVYVVLAEQAARRMRRRWEERFDRMDS